MEGKKIVKYVNTRATEDDDAVNTELTLDFGNVSVEDVYEIAAQAAVIKWQGNARRAKAGIPSKATYVVPRPGTRGTQVFDAHAALVKGFGEVKAKELEVKFGNAEAAFERLKALLEE